MSVDRKAAFRREAGRRGAHAVDSGHWTSQALYIRRLSVLLHRTVGHC